MKTAKLITAILFIISATITTSAQWRPEGPLARIPVIENCSMTNGDIAVAGSNPQPVIYYCQKTVDILNSRYPGVSWFYYVHEFGHHALQTSSEPAADCWAAQQLKKLQGGEEVIRTAARHFRDRFNAGEPINPRYGSMLARAEGIERCANAVPPPHPRMSIPANPFPPISIPSSPAVTSPAVNKNLESFFSFLGINYGDTIDTVREKFGEPEDKRTSEGRNGSLLHLLYFDSGVEFVFNAETGIVRDISVSRGETVKALKDAGIGDNQLDFIGKHKSKVEKAFGQPKSTSLDNFTFESGSGGRLLEVAFQCLGFAATSSGIPFDCDKITVRWR